MVASPETMVDTVGGFVSYCYKFLASVKKELQVIAAPFLLCEIP